MIFQNRKILEMFLWLILSLAGVGSVFADELQKYFAEGQRAYEQGNYEKAASLYENVVEIDPNYAPAYNALGLTYMGLNGNIDDITWLFKVATEIDPNYLEAYDNQCKVYYQARKFSEAEASCLKILSLSPNLGSAQLTLGWIYLGKSQPDRAVGYFEEVLKRAKVPAIYFGLGTAYAQSGKHAQVLDVVTHLRGLGELQMAAQLESMIRTHGPSAVAPPSVGISERQPGTLVPSGSAAVSSASEEPAAPPSAGSMRVRLRGKLGTSAAATAAGSAQGSSSSSYGANRSAIERIRELQRKRLGAPSRSTSGY